MLESQEYDLDKVFFIWTCGIKPGQFSSAMVSNKMQALKKWVDVKWTMDGVEGI